MNGEDKQTWKEQIPDSHQKKLGGVEHRGGGYPKLHGQGTPPAPRHHEELSLLAIVSIPPSSPPTGPSPSLDVISCLCATSADFQHLSGAKFHKWPSRLHLRNTLVLNILAGCFTVRTHPEMHQAKMSR